MRDNIRLGTDWIQQEDVEQAAQEVNVADFIRTLPQGFHEPVRERGSTLSTGQKQLISFARALAHDPRILVLDEATSSVDTETEFRVRDALSHMKAGQVSGAIPVTGPQGKGYRIVQLIAKEPAGQRELTDPRVQQAIREQLRQRLEQLLKTAYYEVARNQAKVENYSADDVLKNPSSVGK